jgi:hypothetical protein
MCKVSSIDVKVKSGIKHNQQKDNCAIFEKWMYKNQNMKTVV